MQGVNVKVAQEHLGHKDISTTMNIYSHVLPSVAKEVEPAVAFLNFAMTSPEINTLMAWGVEGVDYEVVDDDK